MRIAVTGASGLLGWHLRCRLASLPRIRTLVGGRDLFEDGAKLSAFVRSADAVIHLAGMNRGSELEVEAVNVSLAEMLVHALDHAATKPAVIFSSSVHIDGDSTYGRSKRRAGDLLEDWAERSGGRFVNLVLPHVFGEHGRPFYNSVVATFAYQLARGEKPELLDDSRLELLHAQDVADLIVELAGSTAAGEVRPAGFAMTVSQLLARLRAFASEYRDGMMPSLPRPIDVALFNTYRSYLYPDRFPVELSVREDARGRLFEAVKNFNGGQTFISSTRPGITRGNHYHRRKIERFLVIEGEAQIKIRRLFHDSVVCFRVSGNRPQFVDMPTLHTHSITNVGGSDLLTLFWANEIFDPANPDTEAEQV